MQSNILLEPNASMVFAEPIKRSTHPLRFSILLLLLLPFLLPPLLLIPSPREAIAQVSPQFYDYPKNHLPWYTIESPNFFVHFQEGSSRTAQVVSKIAEEIHGPITRLYDHQPEKKVSIVLRDREDYSNGAAFFFDDKIEIWVPALDSPLRGTHRWLRNVITHEYLHIIQIQSSMTREKSIPAIYLQWLSYENVRRPDVLYGYPKGIFTLPFTSVGIPGWFAEGTAQYQRAGLFYDQWDTHRDMILRTRILTGTQLGFERMGTFSSKTSIERETVYNQGFAFVIYLTHRFGEQVVADISRAAAESGKTDFSSVIEVATGIPGTELFDDFVEETLQQYQAIQQTLKLTSSETLEPDGFFNFYPQFSPDGEWFGYISNRGRDGSRTSLILERVDENGNRAESNREDPQSATLIEDLNGMDRLPGDIAYEFSHGLTSGLTLDFIGHRYSFSPDSRQLAYSRARKNKVGETYQDLYIYDFETEESQRITHNARIQGPVWNPAGDLTAIRLNDGTQNIVLVDPKTGDITPMTSFTSGETVHDLSWHPDGRRLIFSAAMRHNRSLYQFDSETGTMKPLLESPILDIRDPWIDASGEWLYFSSDREGIFNVYRVRLDAWMTQNRDDGDDVEVSEPQGGLEAQGTIVVQGAQDVQEAQGAQMMQDAMVEKLTEVIGGAFMPSVQRGEIYYADYREDGYKIAKTPIHVVESIPLDVFLSSAPQPESDNITISPVRIWHQAQPYDPSVAALNDADDRAIQPFSSAAVERSNEGVDEGADVEPNVETGVETGVETDVDTDVEEPAARARRESPSTRTKQNLQGATNTDLRRTSNTDLGSRSNTGQQGTPLRIKGDEDTPRTLSPYREQTTGLSVFPVVRFDNYTLPEGRNHKLLTSGNLRGLGENLWRDTKVGAYLSSRDVTERLTLFAGGLIGLGSIPAEGANDFFAPSRLNDLDRDLFFIAEYQGLPFLKRSWSPTISVEVYNLTRNVKDGLSIEEFPCTSCLPESKNVDIRYKIWEAGLYLRSKLNRWSLLELGAAYSPYSVVTDGFFSDELQLFIPGSTSEYFQGATFSGSYIADLTVPARNYDIAPTGLKGRLSYRYEPGRLLREFDVEDGILKPVYFTNRNHSLELVARYGRTLSGPTTAMITTRGYSYLNKPDDFFYLDYVGGVTGLRSYPFFAVGGQSTAFARFSLLTPLMRAIDLQLGANTIDKIYAHLFFETGNGWGGPLQIGDNLKHGLGGELRIAFNRNYLMPMKFFVSTSYGLNRFSVTLPDSFVTESEDNRVTYGREFLFYFGLTFDFDFL